MATTLTPTEKKEFAAGIFKDFVDRQKAEVIHHNMT